MKKPKKRLQKKWNKRGIAANNRLVERWQNMVERGEVEAMPMNMAFRIVESGTKSFIEWPSLFQKKAGGRIHVGFWAGFTQRRYIGEKKNVDTP